MNGVFEVGDELFLPGAEDSVGVELTQVLHSPGREDHIPYETKVLNVSDDDLHQVRFNHELSKGHTSIKRLNGFFNVRTGALALADVTMNYGIGILLLADETTRT